MGGKSDGYLLENGIQDDLPQSTSPLLRKPCPRRPQDTPGYANTLQDALRGARNSPKTRPRDPKTRLGRLPRRPQGILRSTQDAARHTQDAPIRNKGTPISSKSRPDLPQTSILAHFGDDFEGFFWICAGSWRRTWIDVCYNFQSLFSPSFVH